jgi:hypothetical protein
MGKHSTIRLDIMRQLTILSLRRGFLGIAIAIQIRGVEKGGLKTLISAIYAFSKRGGSVALFERHLRFSYVGLEFGQAREAMGFQLAKWMKGSHDND